MEVSKDIEESGVLLILRFLTHIRQRRGSEDAITRAFLRRVERDERMEIAYPTWRVYRRGEEAGWSLLDCDDLVVHVMSPTMREFYDLEKLWFEAKVLYRQSEESE